MLGICPNLLACFQTEPLPISFAEEAQYLAAASNTVRDAATLAADTGLRPNSELFVMEWFNVHLECSQDAPQGYVHIPYGKTDAATRNIPLTTRTLVMFLAITNMR